MGPKFFVINLKYLLSIIGIILITLFIIVVFLNLIAAVSNNMLNVELI